MLAPLLTSASIALLSQTPPFNSEVSRMVVMEDWPSLMNIASEEITKNPKNPSAWIAKGIAAAALNDGLVLKSSLDQLALIDLASRVRLLNNPMVDKLAFGIAPTRISFSQIKISLQPNAPSYPSIAKNQGVHGDVLLDVWIDAEGKPEKVFVLWGPSELQQTAHDYILNWRFTPFQINRLPTPVRFRMVMPFRLLRGGQYLKLPTDLLPSGPA